MLCKEDWIHFKRFLWHGVPFLLAGGTRAGSMSNFVTNPASPQMWRDWQPGYVGSTEKSILAQDVLDEKNRNTQRT